MAAIRLGLIWRYLRPHRRVLLGGVLALVVVNLLSVTIPLMVRGIIDDLQDGLTVSYVLRQAGWIVLLASLMGVARLISRLLVFGVGRKVEASLRTFSTSEVARLITSPLPVVCTQPGSCRSM